MVPPSEAAEKEKTRQIRATKLKSQVVQAADVRTQTKNEVQQNGVE